MPTVQQIYEVLAALAPADLAEEWDNVGLLVDAGRPVTRVMTTLDITADVVRQASEAGCQLIVSHHPVIFKGLKKLSPQDVAYQLVRCGISAICMHTNLDAAEGGVNDVLAALFGLQSTEAFAGGCGRIGTVDEITAPALAQKAKQLLCAGVKYADAGKPIRRLALVSGSGASFFAEAAALGADCLLTGEAGHHAALDAQALGISLVAASHFSTERPVVPVLAALLEEQFPGLQAVCSRESDPFVYL